MDGPSAVLGCLECGGGEFHLLHGGRVVCANEDCGAILLRSGTDFEVRWQTSGILAKDTKK